MHFSDVVYFTRVWHASFFTFTYPLKAVVFGAPQMTSQPAIVVGWDTHQDSQMLTKTDTAFSMETGC